MKLRFLRVNSFTDQPFSGNPATVCFLAEPSSEDWMQSVAAEMNTGGTAFLTESGGEFGLRFFTPAVEVELSGHTTLAAAHALWEEGLLPSNAPARFQTKAGPLGAERRGKWIELDFPSEPQEATDSPADLEDALGIPAHYVGRNRFDYLVEVDSEEALRQMRPDFPLLATIPTRGVMVTSASGTRGYDFVSRFFAPRAGLPEDQVTGSAHCCLGPFWMERLGKKELLAYQASRRGGSLRVRVEGERVKLAGQAVTVLRGNLTTPAE